MKKTKKRSAHWYIAAPIVLVTVVLYGGRFLTGIENSYLDFLFNARLEIWGVRPIDDRLILAAIDDKSIREIGKVPWPRSVYARLLDELFKYSPNAIALDVLFTEPDKRNPEEDQALVAATKRHNDKIIHSFFEAVENTSGGTLALPRITIEKPFTGLLELKGRLGFVDNQKISGNDVFSMTDPDGAVRRAFLAKQTAEGEVALSLGSQIFAKLNGYDETAYIKKGFPEEITINFPGVVRQYTQGGKVIENEPYTQVSITDILEHRLSAELKARLKGSLIFIASVATGYYDHYPTPYSPSTPGVVIHMYALENLIKGNFITSAPRLLHIALIV
ncbi:MAG: CHASE2 domain-containing protein, partial [Elusimicrobiota bacterium]